MPDDAASFYEQLETLLDSGWEIRKKYDALRDVFRRAVNQEISLTNLNFSGTFAKLDYLIKEKGISEAESVRLHAHSTPFLKFPTGNCMIQSAAM
mgnify:CR=1 FL=1